MAKHPLEPGIVTDFSDRLTYAGYLHLDQLLSSQRPLSGTPSTAPRHDEMLFIIQHQVSELWMKLMLHELKAAIGFVRVDRARRQLQDALAGQIDPEAAVRAVVGPGDADAVRIRRIPLDAGSSSGFQSAQYRAIELLLGNKHRPLLDVFRYDPGIHAELVALLEAPSLYDEFLRHLSRRGLGVPASCVERDWSQPHQRNAELVQVFKLIYDQPEKYWDAYEMAEKLVDVEESFQLWRFRHLKTVERIIGHKPGTGGSSGVNFLKNVLDHTFFPELIDVRTVIGAR
jgi:tryptophan 2,3-dioxygenase